MEKGKMRRLINPFLAATLLLAISIYLSGCNSEKNGENLKGTEATKEEIEAGGVEVSPEASGPEEMTGAVRRMNLRIEPERPGKGDQLMAMMMESKGRPVYRWYVNGEMVKESEDPVLNTDNLKKGDSVMVKVMTRDGEFTSREVTIVNTPPVIKKAFLLPVSPKKGDTLRVDVEAEDPDGDDVYIRYEWGVNNMAVGSDSNTLQADINRGDNVVVRITPFDKEYTEGRTVERSVVIGNAPPVVEERIKGLKVTNGLLTGRIEATDPDGDPVEFRIVDAPEGMKIDNDGTINWILPEAVSGTYAISVMVSDGHGGESLFNFEISLKARKE
jgi:hypothetical protein